MACVGGDEVALGLHVQADRLQHLAPEGRAQQAERAQFVHVVKGVRVDGPREQMPDVVEQGRDADGFDVDDLGNAFELNDGIVPSGLEDKARLAVANCPEFAITIED